MERLQFRQTCQKPTQLPREDLVKYSINLLNPVGEKKVIHQSSFSIFIVAFFHLG